MNLGPMCATGRIMTALNKWHTQGDFEGKK